VDVDSADTDRLHLVARGSVSFDVDYRLRPHADGLRVEAWVCLHRREGLVARVMRTAVAAALNSGALGTALRRVDELVSRELDAALLCV
jgi:hypothetical protein